MMKAVDTLEKTAKSGMIRLDEEAGGESKLQTIAKIDRTKYSGISDKIRRAVVVLTDNQKNHIIKRRGQEFFDKYSPWFKEIVEDPDFVFKDKAHKRTAIASKTIALDGKNINLIIRLAVEGDKPDLENSIITAIVENEKRYKQRLRNNIPLYKKG